MDQLVYIDESGMDDRQRSDYAWALRGERYHAQKPGKKTQRLSMIGALHLKHKNFFAPMIFEGTCNSALFFEWIDKILIPELPVNCCVVMDNASIHRSAKIKEKIESAGCHLIYLPPYSPDLNPIEHYWFKIKHSIKKLMTLLGYSLEKAMTTVLKKVSSS